MKAYISVNYSKRGLLNEELNTIVDTLNEFKIGSLIFVDHYKFELIQEHQMMKQAMSDIDSCDILIAEVSYKGIGIGIEAGYAKAKNKPVIYVRQHSSEHSTTVSGISDYKIIYGDAMDLRRQLVKILSILSTN